MESPCEDFQHLGMASLEEETWVHVGSLPSLGCSTYSFHRSPWCHFPLVIIAIFPTQLQSTSFSSGTSTSDPEESSSMGPVVPNSCDVVETSEADSCDKEARLIQSRRNSLNRFLYTALGNSEVGSCSVVRSRPRRNSGGNAFMVWSGRRISGRTAPFITVMTMLLIPRHAND